MKDMFKETAEKIVQNCLTHAADQFGEFTAAVGTVKEIKNRHMEDASVIFASMLVPALVLASLDRYIPLLQMAIQERAMLTILTPQLVRILGPKLEENCPTFKADTPVFSSEQAAGISVYQNFVHNTFAGAYDYWRSQGDLLIECHDKGADEAYARIHHGAVSGAMAVIDVFRHNPDTPSLLAGFANPPIEFLVQEIDHASAFYGFKSFEHVPKL